MRRIYLDRRHSSLSIQQGRLEIRWPDQAKLVHFPLTQLDAVIATVHVEISTSVVFEMEKHGVDFICLSRGKSSPAQLLTTPSHRHVQRQQKQAILAFHDETKLHFACSIVSARVRQQHHLLKNIYRKRPDLTISLLNGMAQLGHAINQCQVAKSLRSLRGMEGAATAKFFSAYKTAFAFSLGFEKRIRRPPTDPVNALLSLAYSLTHKEAERTLYAAGLNPAIGALHDISYGRASLACDLTELFRVRVEFFVWRIFAEQTLRAHHFFEIDTACLLNKSGRAIIFPLYEIEARKWRKSMRRIAEKWSRQVDSITLPDSINFNYVRSA